MPDDTVVSCAKMAEPIEMSFGLWAQVSSRNHVLDGDRDIPMQRSSFYWRGGGLP